MATAHSPYEKHMQKIAEAEAVLAQLQQEAQSIRGEELKVLADGYAKKVKAAGFTMLEAVKALAPYDDSKKTRAKKGEGKARPVRAVETGVTYKDPATGATWKAGPKGRTVGWLQAYINAGRSASEFVVAKGGGTDVGNG